jgi:hypothetical protein
VGSTPRSRYLSSACPRAPPFAVVTSSEGPGL